MAQDALPPQRSGGDRWLVAHGVRLERQRLIPLLMDIVAAYPAAELCTLIKGLEASLAATEPEGSAHG